MGINKIVSVLDRIEEWVDRWLDRTSGVARSTTLRDRQASESSHRSIQIPKGRWRVNQSVRTRERVREIARASGWKSAIGYLRKIDPLVFEEFVLTGFEMRGHRVRRSQRYSGDGGIDGRVFLHGEWWLIQSKRYAASIRPEDVREFARVCEREAARGFFVHTGRTGPQSRRAFRRNPAIQVLSGRQMVRHLLDMD
ncbi:restriction endonuclease [Thioalkalivibrio sp. ALE16]|uniref:restriction endonuclease n=1 Tax=Thioalkalivibrio sp. ALE16 TaxID=1158172 RepID=UPI0009DB8683